MIKKYEQLRLSELVKVLTDEFLKNGDKYIGFEKENTYTSSFHIECIDDIDLIFKV